MLFKETVMAYSAKVIFKETARANSAKVIFKEVIRVSFVNFKKTNWQKEKTLKCLMVIPCVKFLSNLQNKHIENAEQAHRKMRSKRTEKRGASTQKNAEHAHGKIT